MTPNWADAVVILALFVLGALHRLEVLCNRQAISRTNRPAEDAYRAGYDYGYDEGWHAGRASQRPTVVPFPPTGTEDAEVSG
jgi:hypothetical protein